MAQARIVSANPLEDWFEANLAGQGTAGASNGKTAGGAEETERLQGLMSTYGNESLLDRLGVTAAQAFTDRNGQVFVASQIGDNPPVNDYGDRLKTENDPNADQIRAMLNMAKEHGWTRVSIKGKPEYMEFAQTEAERLGIRITRYTPVRETPQKSEPRARSWGSMAPFSEQTETTKQKTTSRPREVWGRTVQQQKTAEQKPRWERFKEFFKGKSKNLKLGSGGYAGRPDFYRDNPQFSKYGRPPDTFKKKQGADKKILFGLGKVGIIGLGAVTGTLPVMGAYFLCRSAYREMKEIEAEQKAYKFWAESKTVKPTECRPKNRPFGKYTPWVKAAAKVAIVVAAGATGYGLPVAIGMTAVAALKRAGVFEKMSGVPKDKQFQSSRSKTERFLETIAIGGITMGAAVGGAVLGQQLGLTEIGDQMSLGAEKLLGAMGLTVGGAGIAETVGLGDGGGHTGVDGNPGGAAGSGHTGVDGNPGGAAGSGHTNVDGNPGGAVGGGNTGVDGNPGGAVGGGNTGVDENGNPVGAVGGDDTIDTIGPYGPRNQSSFVENVEPGEVGPTADGWELSQNEQGQIVSEQSYVDKNGNNVVLRNTEGQGDMRSYRFEEKIVTRPDGSTTHQESFRGGFHDYRHVNPDRYIELCEQQGTQPMPLPISPVSGHVGETTQTTDAAANLKGTGHGHAGVGVSGGGSPKIDLSVLNRGFSR